MRGAALARVQGSEAAAAGQTGAAIGTAVKRDPLVACPRRGISASCVCQHRLRKEVHPDQKCRGGSQAAPGRRFAVHWAAAQRGMRQHLDDGREKNANKI